MNLKGFLLAAITIITLSAVDPHVGGQSVDAPSCLGGWEWNQNSLQQGPCAVASILDAACRGIDRYTVKPLSSSQKYESPQGDNADDLRCECDTVMYSLYMACASCQGALVYSWTTWIAQCGAAFIVAYYPHEVPYGTAIPAWAFDNVTSFPDQTYSDSVAKSIGDYPEETPTPTYTPPPQKKSHIGAIVGGAVGGVVFVTALAAAVTLVIKRRQRGAVPPPPEKPMPPMSPVPPSLATTPAIDLQAPYYNPNDPTTFPPPMGGTQNQLAHANVPPVHGQYRLPNHTVPQL